MKAKSDPFVICKQEGRYIGWPTVARTAEGALLVAFSGDRDLHVCPFGKTFTVRSLDDGATWSAPERVNDTPLDDRDAGLLVLRSGTILLTWFTSVAFDIPEQRDWQGGFERVSAPWRQHVASITTGDRRRWLNAWSRRSTDHGRTWEEPVAMAGSSPHGPCRLDDGRVLHMGNLMNVDRQRVVVEETSDEGLSWRVIAEVPVPPSIQPHRLCEPHVCQARDGRLIALFRWEPPDVETCGLWQAESRDGGRTWDDLGPTTMRGYPPHLLRLGDGRILASYGHRRPPYGQMACLRRDGGGTWDLANEIMICDGPNRDLGYPASIELRDGRILTVFYQIDQPGEKPCLMGAIWAPDSGA